MQRVEKTIRVSEEILDEVREKKPVEYKTGRFIEKLLKIGLEHFRRD